MPNSEWPPLPRGIWKMTILIHVACSWFSEFWPHPFNPTESLKSNVQISEYDLPPCQIRKTYPEAVCTAHGHNSKWQVHIRSKNPKWVPDTFSVRPSGLENIDSPLKLTCLLSYRSTCHCGIFTSVPTSESSEASPALGKKNTITEVWPLICLCFGQLHKELRIWILEFGWGKGF